MINSNDVNILGIGTSCDETAAAVVRNGRTVLSNVVLSQIGEHAAFGGVVPEVASRKHLEAVMPVVDEAIKRSGLTLGGIDAVAVTYGPGLVGALLVGLSFAKGIAMAKNIPLIGVHHIAAHILAISLSAQPQQPGEPEPPFTALVASGGHSSVYYVENYRTFRLVGRTRDDAAGEALDKVARATGLGYPGGQKLEAASAGGNPGFIRFPRTVFRDGTFDFSFSGVKTAAINCYKRELAKCGGSGAALTETFYRDFYASYQDAVTGALAANTLAAEQAANSGKIVVAGGVAANGELRKKFYAIERESEGRIKIFFPPPEYCGDNAAMVAARAFHDYAADVFSPLTLNAESNAKIK